MENMDMDKLAVEIMRILKSWNLSYAECNRLIASLELEIRAQAKLSN